MKYNKKNIFIFLIGLFSVTQIRVVGALGVSELVAVAALPFLLKRLPVYFKNRRFRTVMVLSLLWFVGAIISDLYNKSETYDLLRGWGSCLMFSACLIFMYWFLKDNVDRVKWFLLGVAFSGIISQFILPMQSIAGRDGSEEMMGLAGLDPTANIWMVYFISSFVMYFAFVLYKRHRLLTLTIMFGYGVFMLFNMSRNGFLIYAATTAILLYIGYVSDRNRAYKEVMFRKRLPLFMILIIGVGLIIKTSYEYSAKNGILGEQAKAKYDMQEVAGLGLIESGRKEPFIGMLAVMDAPIIGHGSWAPDTKGYSREFAIQSGNMDLFYAISSGNTSGTIPAHSHIVGAWVWHGILGALFWGYIIYLCCTFALRYLFARPDLMAYMIAMILSLLWNILFSPFGGRLIIATNIVLMTIIMYEYDKQKKICLV